MGTRSGRLEDEIDHAVAERANAAGVGLDEILEQMAMQLGAAASLGLGACGPLDAARGDASGTAAAQELLARGADALVEVFARAFATPEEARAYAPEVVAGITGAATYSPS